MPISDKTRKLLWGRSGNRCAICNQELIVSATLKDNEAVIGDECHIISGVRTGPRYDNSYPNEKVDLYENLILLCRVHHKMIDDQPLTYTKEIICKLKYDHEIQVSEKLSNDNKLKPIRFRRVRKNIPDYLVRVTTGKQLIDLFSGASAFSYDNDEPENEEEADIIGNFVQELQDWIDIIDDMEPIDKIKGAFNLTKTIREIEQNGFFIFAGREKQLIEGGVFGEPSNWTIALVRILHSNNKEIIPPLNMKSPAK